MPIPFTFHGEPVSLGRFGNVRPGDMLWLSDQEADCIATDRRFRKVQQTDLAGLKEPEDTRLAELRALPQPDLLQLAEALNALGYPITPRPNDEATELVKKIVQARQFDPAQYTGRAADIASVLAQRSQEELQGFCKLVQQEGKPISWNPYMSRMELVQALVNSKFIPHEPAKLEAKDPVPAGESKPKIKPKGK